jgi:glycosyltransferase involved in cell wall biosynthesis
VAGEPRVVKVLAGVFNPIAYDGRVQRAAEALAEQCEVTVVCPAGPELPRSVPLTVVPVPLSGGGFPKDYARFVRTIISTARTQRPDLIHAHDYFMALPGLIASRITGARLVYDAHELIVPERGVPRTLVLRVFSFMEGVTVPRSDLVVAANLERAERMAEHYSMPALPLVIRNIPPMPPPAAPTSRVDSLLHPRRRSSADFLLVYQGHLKLRRGLGRVLEALVVLPESFRLIIVGGGPDQQLLLQRIGSMGLADRVDHLGRVPRTALPVILTQCDAGVLTYSYDTLNDRLCAPNKVYEYAQAGLPILATDQPPLRRIFESYDMGQLIGEEDGAQEIAAAVQRLAHRPKKDYQPVIQRFLHDNRWEAEAERLRLAVCGITSGRPEW